MQNLERTSAKEILNLISRDAAASPTISHKKIYNLTYDCHLWKEVIYFSIVHTQRCTSNYFYHNKYESLFVR